jgi:hypothetical protein
VTLALTSLIVTAVAVAAGGVLLFLERRGERRKLRQESFNFGRPSQSEPKRHHA